MIFSIALGALSIFRGFQDAQMQKHQSKIAEQNAQYASELAVNNAEIEKQNNKLRAESQFEQQRRRRAVQEASYATSGILLDGTPSQYLQAQVEVDELNMERQNQASYARQMNILYKGQQERSNLLAQADAYKQSATASILGGFMGAGAYAMMGMGSDTGSGFSWMGSGGSEVASSAGSTSIMSADLASAYEPLTLGGY